MMKNLFLNDLVFLLTNRFRLKKSLTEFSPDLFGTLNGNCFIANAILLKKKGSGLIIKKLTRLKRTLLTFDF